MMNACNAADSGLITEILAGGSSSGLPVGTVTIGEEMFTVEVAATDASRARGLMGRRSLASDAGMIFVFDPPQPVSFWMKDTLLPLDIAFIRADRTIARTATMEPLSLQLHSSVEPVQFALEVNAGEFARRGIGPSDTVTLSTEVEALASASTHLKDG